MTDDQFKIFGLTNEATLGDVKKAYRKLAKNNHPDLFPEPAKKSTQEKIMARFNEAYQALVKYFQDGKKENKTGIKSKNAVKREEADDTSLYKKGVEYFGKYQGSISLKFPQYTRFDKESIREKASNLKEAAKCFEKIVNDYPESDWAYDSEERLRKIEKILKNLVEKDTKETLPRDNEDFYYNKFRKTFKK